jgi:hypothetical protein
MRFSQLLWATTLAGCVSYATPRRGVSPAEARAPAGIERVDPPQAGFYGKRVWYGHIPVLAHESVSDDALLEARDRLDRLLSRAPRLLDNLERERFELHVIGLHQFTSDLPEHRAGRGQTLRNGELFDWHMIGGHIVGRYGSCAEATLLPVVGHRLFGDDACLHELGHAIHMLAVGREVRERILDRYEAALATGEWKDTYAATDEREFFAEATKVYFQKDAASPSFYRKLPAHDRAWLCSIDPGTCTFIRDLYSDASDPGSPRFQPLALRSALLEPSMASGHAMRHSHILVRNDTRETVHAVWIDFAGKRHPLAEDFVAAPGSYIDLDTYVTHAWVLTNHSETTLCTFVAPDADAEGSLTGPCG